MNEAENEAISRQDGDIRRYWLGQLPPDEAVRLEDRYFSDNELFEHVNVVKEELIDDYLFNRLAQEDRRSFDAYFLRPEEHRQHVDIIRGLIERLKEAPQPQPAVAPVAAPGERGKATFGQFWRDLSAGFKGLAWTAAAVALFAVIGALTLYRKNHQLRQDVAQLRADQQRREDEYQRTLAALRAQSGGTPTPSPSFTPRPATSPTPRILPATPESATATVFASLLSTLTRSGQGIERVTISPATQRVSLKLLLDQAGTFASYQAQLKTDGGQVVQRKNGLRPAVGKAIVVEFPASLFAEGKYSVVLYGVDGKKAPAITGDYSFRVVKE